MAGIPIIVLVLLVRAILSARASSSSARASGSHPPFVSTLTGRAFLYYLLVVIWALFVLPSVLVGLVGDLPALGRPGSGVAFAGVARTIAFATFGVVHLTLLLFSWPILRAMARLGRPKLVYYLAHVALIFPRTGETYSGACLLAMLSLAHRGDATREELAWIRQRLRKEYRPFGTYATACALHQELKARRARNDGDFAKAFDLSERCRIVLGTVTYLSARGIPRGPRRVAYEILTLKDMQRGHWGWLDSVPEKMLTQTTRLVRSWEREWLRDEPADPKTARMRRRIGKTGFEALFARPRESEAYGAERAWLEARRAFVALQSGKFVGPRAALSMLNVFDFLLHPECEENVLSPELANDPELLASVHDAVADALTKALENTMLPIYAKPRYGPVSARVYQRLEVALVGKLERAMDATKARVDADHRLDSFGEWVDVSYLRSAYRQLESTLGPEAAARVYPRFAYVYGNLGVMLSERIPRNRPLAYAVFNVLHKEAERFEDPENVRQQTHNMKVTSGIL